MWLPAQASCTQCTRYPCDVTHDLLISKRESLSACVDQRPVYDFSIAHAQLFRKRHILPSVGLFWRRPPERKADQIADVDTTFVVSFSSYFRGQPFLQGYFFALVQSYQYLPSAHAAIPLWLPASAWLCVRLSCFVAQAAMSSACMLRMCEPRYLFRPFLPLAWLYSVVAAVSKIDTAWECWIYKRGKKALGNGLLHKQCITLVHFQELLKSF